MEDLKSLFMVEAPDASYRLDTEHDVAIFLWGRDVNLYKVYRLIEIGCSNDYDDLLEHCEEAEKA